LAGRYDIPVQTLVEESMASVRDAILVGIVLCLLVITALLRDLRAGVVHSMSVPVTLFVTERRSWRMPAR
jgi:multidrug efflux pump subunit AcrB